MGANGMETQQSDVGGGRVLSSLRQRAGITQTQLAKSAGISRSMVAQLEIGERKPSRKMLKAMCDAMSVSEDDERQLLLAYQYSPVGETPEQIEAFLRADRNLRPEQVQSIAALVREAYERALVEE